MRGRGRKPWDLDNGAHDFGEMLRGSGYARDYLDHLLVSVLRAGFRLTEQAQYPDHPRRRFCIRRSVDSRAYIDSHTEYRSAGA
jgi:hypothetical protein